MASEKMERFTAKGRMCVFKAQELCENFHHKEINLYHLILGLTQVTDCDAYLALDDFDITYSKLVPYFKHKQPTEPNPETPSILDLSPNFRQALYLSVETSRRLGLPSIGTSQVLIGALRGQSEPIISILEHFDVQAKDLIKAAKSYTNENVEFLQNITRTNDSSLTRYVSSIFRFLGMSDNDKRD